MAAAGVTAAAVYNAQRTKESDPLVSAVDFIPQSLSEISRVNVESEGPDLDLATLSAFFGATRKTDG